MELTGEVKILTILDDRVVIKPKKILGIRPTLGDLELFYNQMTAVELNLGTTFSHGHINFMIPGVSKTVPMVSPTAVLFKKKDNELAQDIKNKVDELRAKYITGKTQDRSNNSNNTDDSEIIRKYKQLYDDGIITKDEFEAKKKEILGI